VYAYVAFKRSRTFQRACFTLLPLLLLLLLVAMQWKQWWRTKKVAGFAGTSVFSSCSRSRVVVGCYPLDVVVDSHSFGAGIALTQKRLLFILGETNSRVMMMMPQQQKSLRVRKV
jgi:hypothetical protein